MDIPEGPQAGVRLETISEASVNDSSRSEASVKDSSRSNITNPSKTPPVKTPPPPDDPGGGVICQNFNWPSSLLLESWRTWSFLMNLEVVSYERDHTSEASV